MEHTKKYDEHKEAYPNEELFQSAMGFCVFGCYNGWGDAAHGFLFLSFCFRFFGVRGFNGAGSEVSPAECEDDGLSECEDVGWDVPFLYGVIDDKECREEGDNDSKWFSHR